MVGKSSLFDVFSSKGGDLMLSKDSQDLLELDVQEYALTETVADVPSQTIPPRTLTTCALC